MRYLLNQKVRMRKVFLALCASAVLLAGSCTETYSAQPEFEAPAINTTMVSDSAAVHEAVIPANPQAQTYVQQYNYQSVAPAHQAKQKPQSFGDIVLEVLQVCFTTFGMIFVIFLFYAGTIVIFNKFFEIIYGK